MISFQTILKKFDRKGEKTGWTYLEIRQAQANKLAPQQKISFRVKGTLDAFMFEKTAVLPMGDGSFILPVNATFRKAIRKAHGEKVKVTLEVDNRKLQLSHDLMTSLKEDPVAMTHFKSLALSHQHYFSKWIESAKTSQTKTKRIVMAIIALGKKQGYPEMIRENRPQPY